MKYIIDPTVEFTGCVITSMSDDVHSDYGNETLEELRSNNKNPSLIAVGPDKMSEMVNNHRSRLNSEPFIEIDEERYYDLLDCLPPERMLSGCFFVGECCQYDIYPFCFTIDGRFFQGKRIISTPREKLYAEIKEFYQNLKMKEAHGS